MICGLLALPVGDSAAEAAVVTSYPPDQAARELSTGPAGWTQSSSTDGACLPPVLCATLSNTFEAIGGADGNGYLRSQFLGALGLGGVSTATWTSPSFTYDGAAGKLPDTVTFTMSRRSDVASILGVAGNTASYSVDLIDLTRGGAAIPLVPSATLAGADSWKQLSPVDVSPGKLAVGDEYSIRITSQYGSGGSVLVHGSADYDGIELRAVRSQAGNSGGMPGAGPKGGTPALTWQKLAKILLRSSPRRAGVRGRRMFVKVRCPMRAHHACRIRVQALLKLHRPVTNLRTVRVAKGRARLVVLRVRRKLRKRLTRTKRIIVCEKVRAGRLRVTFYKYRKLTRRR